MIVYYINWGNYDLKIGDKFFGYYDILDEDPEKVLLKSSSLGDGWVNYFSKKTHICLSDEDVNPIPIGEIIINSDMYCSVQLSKLQDHLQKSLVSGKNYIKLVISSYKSRRIILFTKNSSVVIRTGAGGGFWLRFYDIINLTETKNTVIDVDISESINIYEDGNKDNWSDYIFNKFHDTFLQKY